MLSIIVPVPFLIALFCQVRVVTKVTLVLVFDEKKNKANIIF